MHFFATASLTDCCQMKGKLAGPIGQGRMAVSPSPLDSVSLSEDFCTLKSSGLSVFLVMDSVSCAASLQPEPLVEFTRSQNLDWESFPSGTDCTVMNPPLKCSGFYNPSVFVKKLLLFECTLTSYLS